MPDAHSIYLQVTVGDLFYLGFAQLLFPIGLQRTFVT